MTKTDTEALLARFIDAKNSGRMDAQHLASILFDHLDDETIAAIAADYFGD